MPGDDDDFVPSLGDLFGMGLTRPVPFDPIGRDLIQPMGAPMGGGMRAPKTVADTLATAVASGRKYPLAKDWYGDMNYRQTGGRMIEMTPDEYLAQTRPMDAAEETAAENIEDLKRHILEGGELDPLALYASGKEDGRHRAHAAKALGIGRLPVLTWRR